MVPKNIIQVNWLRRMVKHLDPHQIRQKGSYYTPQHLVKLVYQLLAKHKISYDFVCDTSGGYGDFILAKDKHRFIYVDIDQKALQICQKNHGSLYQYLHLNSLFDLNRENFKISSSSKLLIVGNPPYNDTTSFFKGGQKGKMLIRDSLKAKDLGIAFLRSYDQLQADYVCVLHPLSYLIKLSNFKALKNFRKNYQLLDGIVVSSQEFNLTSSNTAFPILIALYQRLNPVTLDTHTHTHTHTHTQHWARS